MITNSYQKNSNNRICFHHVYVYASTCSFLPKKSLLVFLYVQLTVFGNDIPVDSKYQ